MGNVFVYFCFMYTVVCKCWQDSHSQGFRAENGISDALRHNQMQFLCFIFVLSLFSNVMQLAKTVTVVQISTQYLAWLRCNGHMTVSNMPVAFILLMLYVLVVVGKKEMQGEIQAAPLLIQGSFFQLRCVN